MHPATKRLDQMDRLGDMLHFPAAVNAGATANVLMTIAATWWLAPRHPGKRAAWIAAVLAVNLLPVAILRATKSDTTASPQLGKMDFFRDQHKFSDWVYLAASANMAFWIALAWELRTRPATRDRLLELEAVAALVTFSPVLLRVRGEA